MKKTNLMNKSTISRILHDLSDIIKNPLHDHGIFYSHNEENIYNGKAMIIGPKNTPYFGGFYLFDFEFPKDYPFSPPKLTFCTQGERIRFNPNLYTNGKVCLSILNTWTGDQWSSIQTISSILLTLSSILIENPLLNEPCIKEDNKELKIYNEIISYSNIQIAYFGMITKKYLPSDFDFFYPIMEEHFLKNYENIIAFCKKKENDIFIDEAVLEMSFYCMNVYVNYTKLVKELIEYENDKK